VAEVVISVMADVNRFCGKLLMLSVMADVIPLLLEDFTKMLDTTPN
jgi:hypothetical protein